MAKNLYNLTAVTTVNDSDLLHVNQGSVSSDKKVTKQNLLKEVNSSITSLNNSLANSYTWLSAGGGGEYSLTTSLAYVFSFTITKASLVRAYVRYTHTPPKEIAICGSTTVSATPLYAYAVKPNDIVAHPLYTPSVMLPSGTYYVFASSTASGTNIVSAERATP